MDVTRHNFEAIMPEILAAIEAAEFVAVDLEFTGLSRSADTRRHGMHTLEEYWRLNRDNVDALHTPQLGLACFAAADDGSYTASVFNFAALRRPVREVTDPYFVSQVSSLLFLSEAGFSFDKMLRDGISWLSPQHESKAVSVVKRKLKQGRRLPDWAGDPEDDLTAEERVQGQVGLRRVLDAVSASGKLVVGHNMGLDMVHLAVSFFGIRSHTLGEYKELMVERLPATIDTKLLAKSDEAMEAFRGCYAKTHLNLLHSLVTGEAAEDGEGEDDVTQASLRTAPLIEFAPGHERYAGDDGDAHHEAGFDAYVTGVVYLGVKAAIATRTSHDVDALIGTLTSKVAHFSHLNEYMDLRGEEEESVNIQSAFELIFTPKKKKGGKRQVSHGEMERLFDDYPLEIWSHLRVADRKWRVKFKNGADLDRSVVMEAVEQGDKRWHVVALPLVAASLVDDDEDDEAPSTSTA